MKRYRAVNEDNEPVQFEVTGDKRIFLVVNSGQRVDITDFTLAGSDLLDPEEALIDLYTDNGSGERVSIEEIK